MSSVGGVEESVVAVMGEGERALACTPSDPSAATTAGDGVVVMGEGERALVSTK